MSYLGNALVRMIEQHGLTQTEVARKAGLSGAHICRVCSGEAKDLLDRHFAGLVKVFAADAKAQAELIAARCLDARACVASTPGGALVEVRIRDRAPAEPPAADLPEHHVHLSRETEKAIAWLRSQCPVNPELEKHLVGYARMLGMGMK